VPSQIRFYADEHIARAVVHGLRRRGIDIVTARDVGLLQARDEEHLEFATEEGRVLITQDTDFLRFHAAGTGHLGIAYAPIGTPVGALIRGLVLIHQVLDAEEMVNRVEFL
jgi:uncharacterized protein with PIN domain